MKDKMIQARDFIAKGWTQRALFRNEKGEIINSSEYCSGCSCCFVGALVMARFTSDGVAEHLRSANPELAGVSFSTWNDHPERTQADVLRVLGRAIEAL